MALNDIITFSDVNLNNGVRDVNSKHVRILDSYPGLDNLGRIRISIPWLNTGFLYLVCKNYIYKYTFTA